MNELCVDDAEVLWEANGLPLLTRSALGKGHVLTVAVPLGALEDEKLHKVFELINESRTLLPSINDDNFSKPGRTTLNNIAGRRGPHERIPFLILTILAAVVLLSGALLRFRRRGEIVWIVLVPAALVFGIGLHTYGSLQTEDERLSHIGLISGIDRDSARTQQIFAYYSGPQEQMVTFSADVPRGVIRHVREAGGMMRTLETRCKGTMRLPNQPVKSNSMSGFQVDTVVQTKGVEGVLTFNESGLTGNLTNHLGAKIEDAVILVNRETYRVGNISGDGETTISVGDGDRLGKDEFTVSLIHQQLDTLRNALVRELLNRPARARQVSRKPVLIGYISTSLLDPLPGRNLQRQGWSVVAWPLQLGPPPPGTKVNIPGGFVDRNDDPNTTVFDPIKAEFNDHNLDSEFVVRARPPEGIAEMRDLAARLRIGIQAQRYHLTISGVRERRDGTRAHVEVKKIRSPTGLLPPVTVPDVNRFKSERDGYFVFSLKVERADQTYDPAGRPKWKFLSIDVALEGVSQ
jgi:hypothetical protein